MHEGQAIVELLRVHDISLQKLADACGLSWGGAQYYIKQAKLKASAWDRCRRGLEELGLDWRTIRDDGSAPALAGNDLASLQARLRKYPASELAFFARMLESNPGTRQRLLDFIAGLRGASEPTDGAAPFPPSRVSKK